jgi:predicted RNase H-like nuclease (RuvC/YqgF family)
VLAAEQKRTCQCKDLIAQNDTGKNDAEEKQEEEEIKPLPPEEYYQLALERQELIISSYKHILKILDYHDKRLVAARKDLLKHEKEKQQKLDALFKKYGTSPRAYYRSWRGTDELEKRSRYLDNHPELRDKLAENSSRIRKLEKKVWEELRPIYRDAEQYN